MIFCLLLPDQTRHFRSNTAPFHSCLVKCVCVVKIPPAGDSLAIVQPVVLVSGFATNEVAGVLRR
jgi:hypothetical protein